MWRHRIGAPWSLLHAAPSMRGLQQLQCRTGIGPSALLLGHTLVSILEKSGLRSAGVWVFIFNNGLLCNSFQKVVTYILIDFALLDDGFHVPNVERIDVQAVLT